MIQKLVMIFISFITIHVQQLDRIMKKLIYRGDNIAESFLPNNFADIGTFGDIGPPFCTGAYIAGSFLPKNFGDIGKFGSIGPAILPPLYLATVYLSFQKNVNQTLFPEKMHVLVQVNFAQGFWAWVG